MKRVLILAAVAALCCAKHEAPPATKSFTVAVIPQGSTHEFWKSIHGGAEKAARDYAAQHIDVRVIWKGPLREDDREQQVQVVEGFLTQHVNGIVLAPFDKNALVRPVEEATRAGIPVVVIDKKLDAVVVQNPSAMGELGVRTVVDHLLGRHVPKRVDMGVRLVR